ncbi:hypothetical protein HanIR_Chr10g0490981 [Helianthus annuus]|nr:hypothetical protein HanIR_Chr10g0490981 [Helianthus annuus]
MWWWIWWRRCGGGGVVVEMWCREEVSWVCFEMGEKRRGLQRCADMSSSLRRDEVRQTFLVRSSPGKQTSCRPQTSARRRHKWPEVLLAKKQTPPKTYINKNTYKRKQKRRKK